jgi:hypothetical protein
MKQRLSQLGFAFVATTCGLITGAYAAEGGSSPPLPSSVPSFLERDVAPETLKWQAVDDDVLAGQTGKFASGQMISGLVLSLLSQWKLPNGGSAVAQGTLTVTQNPMNQLSATVSTAAHVHDGNRHLGTGADPDAQINGGQQVAVNGVSQVTQVAGNSNVGSNSTQIDFSNGAPQAQGSSQGSSLPGSSQGSSRGSMQGSLPGSIAGSTNAASAQASNASGTIQAAVSFGSGGVSVALQTPAGVATQTITPGNAAQAGSIAQLLQIAGNNQQVANQLQLRLQTTQMSPAMLRQAGVMQALQNAINARR